MFPHSLVINVFSYGSFPLTVRWLCFHMCVCNLSGIDFGFSTKWGLCFTLPHLVMDIQHMHRVLLKAAVCPGNQVMVYPGPRSVPLFYSSPFGFILRNKTLEIQLNSHVFILTNSFSSFSRTICASDFSIPLEILFYSTCICIHKKYTIVSFV